MSFLRNTICFILIAAICLTFIGCSQRQQKIDWSLHGAWVTASGDVQDKIELSITGKVPQEYVLRNAVELELDIIWPDSFRFTNQGEAQYSGYADAAVNDSSLPLFWCSGFSYDSALTSALGTTFILCPEKEFVVFNWFDNDDLYLVASTDPNADLCELLEYYLDYFGRDS